MVDLMRHLVARASVFAIIGLAFCLVGCGGPEAPEAVQAVKGQVIYRGQPAVGAIVVFHKVGADPNTGQPSGKVLDDGTFTLTSYRPGDGAAEGEYRVTVSWRQVIGGSLSDPDYGPEKLPEKYQSPETSGLTVTVVTGSNDLEAFQIKD
jgi:hypothetical protein